MYAYIFVYILINNSYSISPSFPRHSGRGITDLLSDILSVGSNKHTACSGDKRYIAVGATSLSNCKRVIPRQLAHTCARQRRVDVDRYGVQ